MNRYAYLIAILTLFARVSLGQTYFNRTYDVDGWPEIGNMLVVEDSTYLITCQCRYNGYFHQGYFRVNQQGDSTQMVHYGDTNSGFAGSLNDGIKYRNGFYYEASSLANLSTSFTDIILIKIDSLTLDTLWIKSYDIENYELSRSVLITKDNGFLIGGFAQPFDGTTYGNPYWFVIKTDSSGNEQWRKTYTNGALRHLTHTVDGNYVAAGFNFGNARIIKIDTLGNLIWGTDIDPFDEDDGFLGVIELADSTLMAYGGAEKNGKFYYLLSKLSFNGDTIWNQVYENFENTNIHKMHVLSDGSYVGCGRSRIDGVDQNDRGSIIKICPNGEFLWERKYGTVDFPSYLYNLQLTDDGGFIATGSTKGISGTQDLWIIKVDSLGCDSPGCAVAPDPCLIDTLDAIVGKSFQNTLSVHPNPFQTSLTITSQKRDITASKIELFSLIGQPIEVSFHQLSNKKILLNTKHLPTGIYILQVEGIGRTKIIKH